MSSFLAFDLGASSGRAIIGKLEKGRLSLTEVHRFANGPTEKDGAIYWNYPQLCSELKEGLRKALAVEPQLRGIGIDTWGVDYVFFDKKSGIEDLLVFKIVYEAKAYNEKHKEEAEKDQGKVFLDFVYENRALFRLMYQNGLTTSIMKAFDALSDWREEKDSAYLRAFFVYGFFGVVYQWIKYDFDETPEEVQRHTAEVILRAMQEKQAQT